MFRGVKGYGKVAYIITLSPYFVLTTLLVYVSMLPGATKGMLFFIQTSDWGQLMDAQIWANAATQILFSLSVGMGGLGTLSSYNRFNNNCCTDSVTVSMTNCATSIFGGFAIFPALGYLRCGFILVPKA